MSESLSQASSSRRTIRPTSAGSGCESPQVGILTFHRCINYGSYWQARCLSEGLRSLGYRSEILDHRSAAAQVAEFRVALQPTLPMPVRPADRAAYALKARRICAWIEQLPLSRPFNLELPALMDDVDTVVIGSDEVWNLRHPWYSGRPPFFGVGLRTRRVVAYAASFGNYSCWEGIGSPWADYLNRLEHLSVRDENSWWMLKHALDRDVPVVLDPTLQFPSAMESSARQWRGPEHPFALVYGHNFSSTFVDQVRTWAAVRRLPLVSIGYANDWADQQWIAADPGDFVAAMQRAEAVSTNFFHGCAMSLRFDRPFACELTPYRSIKVRGLMEHVGGERHLIHGNDGGNRLFECLNEPIDPAVHARIVESRISSASYLTHALSGARVG